MAAKKASKASVADWAWLDERFDKLERDHLAIIKLLKGGSISPELATAINRATLLSRKLDEKVPDEDVPRLVKLPPKRNRKE